MLSLAGVLLSGATLPPRSDILSTMESVADYYLENKDPGCHGKLGKDCTGCGWTHGAFLQGNMAIYRATNNSKYLDYAMWWGEQQKWITCNYPKVLTEHAAANDMSCGQTFAEVYMHFAAQGQKNDTYIAHIRDKVLKVVVERNKIDDWWWDDAYFMAMGTFARIGHITGSQDFHDKNFALYNDSATRRGLWSVPHSLYFRDETYKNKTSPNGAPVFWGRGNGWAAGALARTMMYTPHDHPSYAVYKDRLVSFAAALAKAQGDDGMWRASILDRAHPPNPETTGSSGILIGLAWGVNNGILDRQTYQPVVEKAWGGLTNLAVQKSGLLGYCQPVGGGPNPAGPESTSDFCVGLFLLAANEMQQMASSEV